MDFRPFIYGGLASMAAEMGTFPIDTTKTRLQVQGQVINKSLKELKYRGMLHAMYRISREEGATALYNGIKPALLRQATYGTLKIGLYHGIKRLITEDPAQETLALNVVAGIIAGAVSSSICNPTDVLKVRLQAQTTVIAQRGMILSFVDIWKLEGFKGLYRGVGPTAQRASIIAGVELPVYDSSKRHIIESGLLGDNVATHFLSSVIAGFAGALTSNPIDVIKTRIMNQRTTSTSTNLYTGSVDCFLRTCRTEGFMALYKGFIPTFIRLGPWNILPTKQKTKFGWAIAINFEINKSSLCLMNNSNVSNASLDQFKRIEYITGPIQTSRTHHITRPPQSINHAREEIVI